MYLQLETRELPHGAPVKIDSSNTIMIYDIKKPSLALAHISLMTMQVESIYYQVLRIMVLVK